MITPEIIASISSDEELFELLGKELERRLPSGRRASDGFVLEVRRLPIGLRSMAATYELDVSLTLDDLEWHFGNWHHKRLAEETAAGLDELGATELANIFRDALKIAQLFWEELGMDQWSNWYHGSPLEKALAPLNEKAWAILEKKDQGIFTYWLAYARKYPERLC